MLQNFRDNLKGIGTVIAVIIAVPFALTGVDAFFVSGSAVQKAAIVNGESITELELQRMVNQQRQMLVSQYGENILQMLSDDMLRGQALNQMVRQKAIVQAARSEGMGVATETIQQSLRETPAFQTEDRFDRERFSYVLRQVGHTPSSYAESLRNEYISGQFVQGVAASDFLTAPELALSAGVSEQERDFYYLTVPAQPLVETIEVSEGDLQSRYEQSKDQLVVPEQVVVEYLELTADALMAREHVGEEQIRKAFEVELAAQEPAEQRRLSHILIAKGDDDSHKKTLAEIQQKLADGEDFAKLAKDYSQDPGTALEGGDLGFIDPSALPESLAVVAEHLSLGQVSKPVESDSGVHLLKVTDIEKNKPLLYEEQKDVIAERLKRELAVEQYVVVLEQLKDRVYNAETLRGPADEFGLELQLTKPFSRSGGEGVAANPAVINAAFSEQVLGDGYASEVLELDENRAIVVKLRERVPERIKSFDEVREQLLADIKQERARKQVSERGAELLARVRAGESVEAVAKSENLDWQVSVNTKRLGGNVDGDARATAFGMTEPMGEPEVKGITKSNGDYLLVELTAVKYPNADDLPVVQRRALTRSLTALAGNRAIQSYQSWLVQQAEVEQN